MSKKFRVVMARLGMDAHWRGSVVVSRAIRDAGHEVIYLGNQTPEEIVEIALCEDVDIIGLSTLSGNHMILAPEVTGLLKEKGADDIQVIIGGTISPDDALKLKDFGIAEVFGPGSSLKSIVDFISLPDR
jgi:methylmalonyl-CoA mutase C-terminal domain/subunit